MGEPRAIEALSIVRPCMYFEPVRYFGQTDVQGKLFQNCLYRYRYANNVMYEEVWNLNSGSWEATSLLTGMIIHGECTLEEITANEAMLVSPAALKFKAT